MPDRPTSEKSTLRLSDAQRDQAVEKLTHHVASGRLAIDEFDIRAAQAYAAVNLSDLDVIFEDLPAIPPAAAPVWPAQNRLPMTRELLTWISVGIVCLSIWAITSIATGDFLYPWPAWVIGPWGPMIALQRVTGTSVGCSAMRVQRE
ncbi:DUF1707 domain-containing protein [Rhodococcus sp. G-MC3]|uniref:DUF1707 SHOCT-like domain-containing protein n=1 Tax=Rhodococcus sp. G-MC3 TaxID=3046209 RepID=UPI0024BA487D|nr:DUF1707 domain-containing protein [Rhodococcus sp. G-MC3]MDJ0395706.1 DUF1707 domain-containing protein [Rhodococcus sp. G-MC3]